MNITSCLESTSLFPFEVYIPPHMWEYESPRSNMGTCGSTILLVSTRNLVTRSIRLIFMNYMAQGA